MTGLLFPLSLALIHLFLARNDKSTASVASRALIPLSLMIWLWLYADFPVIPKTDLQPLWAIALFLVLEIFRALFPQVPAFGLLSNLALAAGFIFRTPPGYTVLPALIVLGFLSILAIRIIREVTSRRPRTLALSALPVLFAAVLPFINRNWLPELSYPAALGLVLFALPSFVPVNPPRQLTWVAAQAFGTILVTVTAALHYAQFS